jgi:hypothetical protein
MKRVALLCCAVLMGLALAPKSPAQMGMDLFRKPTIESAFNPVVGKGAAYQRTNKRGPQTMEMAVVGKESVDGKDGYWLEFTVTTEKGPFVGKSLMTKGDFEIHRMIMQMNGQAMELPMGMARQNQAATALNKEDWHSVGNESVTVPAGTFDTVHWRNDKKNSDVWVSDKVSPFGLVKETSPDSSMVLVKTMDSYADKITGPVTKFDPSSMMRQRPQQ